MSAPPSSLFAPPLAGDVGARVLSSLDDERALAQIAEESGVRRMSLDEAARRLAAPHDLATLALLSVHASGHLRQAAVERLAALPPGNALELLLHRRNDWVGAVAQLAAAAIDRRCDEAHADDWVRCLPLVERLARKSRQTHDSLVAAVRALLASPPGRAALERGLSAPSPSLRRAALRAALTPFDEPNAGTSSSADAAWRSHVIARGLRDRDAAVRTIAAIELADAPAAVVRELAPLLRRDRSPTVRRHGLLAVAARCPELANGCLRVALVDRDPSVRRAARRAAREQGLDAVSVYREALAAAASPHRAAALAGLAETGATADAALALPFALYPPARLRSRALHALARLDGEAHVPILLEALVSGGPRVARTAARALAARPQLVDGAMLRRALGDPDVPPHVKRALSRLLTAPARA